MFNSFVVAALILWIGSKLTSGQRLAVQLCLFFLVLLPLTIVLIHLGVFQMVGAALLEVLKAIGGMLLVLRMCEAAVVAGWL